MLPKIFPVTCHTKYVAQGGTFVAIQGQNQSGVHFIEKAVAKGAHQIVVQTGTLIPDDIQQAINKAGVTLTFVKNSREALGRLSAEAAGYPAKQLKIIAITGTKGKTSTAHILYHLLLTAGYKVALIGTVENKISTLKECFKANLTTPQPDYLHQFFKLCVEQKVEYVVMETAAHAVTFSKLETLDFEASIFTNLDREHAELYPTMAEYFQVKKAVLERTKNGGLVLINGDDTYGKQIELQDQKIVFFGQSSTAGFKLSIPQLSLPPLLFLLNNVPFAPPDSFPGTYNCYNITAAVGFCLELGIEIEILQEGVKSLPSIPGRFETYKLPNRALAIIDYAHTADSFEELFKTVRGRAKKLLVVFGASGGKDKQKRPLMGAIAAEYADNIFLTSDNPGFENPAAIVKEIKAGIPEKDLYKVTQELDRKEAIKRAYECSDADTIILLLGKGPDEYQVIENRQLPFSERVVLESLT